MQNLLILGSTGSIGTQSLEVIRNNPDEFRVFGISAQNNWQLLAKQIKEFKPDVAVITDETCLVALEEAVSGVSTKILSGAQSLTDLVKAPEVDIVINSLVGFAGFIPTVSALESGKRVALANKESLVVGGELLKKYLGDNYHQLLPIDSEHSAILQCLLGEDLNSVEKLIITASGGPFRTFTSEQLNNVTVESALKHPNWDMGAKITIDSSTLMNKGLEVIEAYWLFQLPLEKIEAIIHPQSIIHSMVTFTDGSTKAQLGIPDMKVPIQYALTYPKRLKLSTPQFDWTNNYSWTFEPIDTNRFPCFELAMDSIRGGGYLPTVLNASNEVAVRRFLNKEIPYISIHKIIRKSLEFINNDAGLSVESIKETDQETRNYAKTLKI